MTRIRILLADDHLVVCDALALLLESHLDVEIVGKAEDGYQAVALAHKLQPDIAMLDVSMPRLNGFQAAALIRRESPKTQVLILTVYEDDAHFLQALQAGIAGYIPKKANSDELVEAIRTVRKGNVYVPANMTRKLLDFYVNGMKDTTPNMPPGYAYLSDREREIMFLLIEGYTNQEIAAKLVISPSTVQVHRTHIMQKLNLESPTELIRYAIRYHLTEP